MTGEELFLHVRYSEQVRGDEKLIAKLDSFRDKYGFSRNMSFTLLVVGVGLIAQTTIAHFIPSIGGDGALGLNLPKFSHLKLGTLSLVTGLFLFYRYLKFFKQYSYVDMRFTVNWGTAALLGLPSGIPTKGLFFPVDNIGPASVRNSPGNAFDIYNYPSYRQALTSTRTVTVTTSIPANTAGVKCPQ